MPWTMADAKRHTKLVGGKPKASRQWAATANSVLGDSGDEGKASRIANSAVKKAVKQKAPRKKGVNPKVVKV